jgi:putative MFS transporter
MRRAAPGQADASLPDRRCSPIGLNKKREERNVTTSPATIGARLERLPMTSVHRTVFLALAFAYFFELGDLNTFAYAAPAVIKTWGISVDTVALITSASFGGMFLGAVCGGVVADRVGRKRGLFYSLLIYAGFSLLNAAAWNVSSLAIARFITGIGLSSMTVIANTYISEFFPASRRGRYMGLVMTLGLLGIPATAWVSRFAVELGPWGWRLIFVWGSLGMLALAFVARIPESPRWLRSHHRIAAAEAEMEALERIAVAESGALPPPAPAPEPPRHGRVGYSGLLRERYLGRTILLTAVSILGTVGFYGFFSWVPTLLFQHGITVVRSLTYTSVMALCNPLGALIAADLIERFERRWFNVGVSVFVAVCGVAFGLSDDPILIMLLGSLVVMGLQAATVSSYTYASELYPTELRSQGNGITYGIGRVANVGGPFVVAAVFMQFGYVAVFAFIAGCYVVRGLVYLLGPATTGRAVEAVSPSLVVVPAPVRSGPVR